MRARRRGFTLIEVVVLIVVIGIATAGVLLIFQNTVRNSADPQIYKQSLAIAEAMLDEILLNPYGPVAGTGARADFNDVVDYNTFTTAPGGITDIQGNPVAGLGDYNVLVSVTTDGTTALNDAGATLTAVTESRRVTVTVTHAPTGISVALDGYRLNYAGP